MNEKKFVYVTYIDTTPEKLWEALTNTEFMKKYWFGSNFETDWKIGSTIKETQQDGSPGFQGEIVQFEPPQLLSYTFHTESEMKTQVTFDIKPQSATAVKLTTTHEGYEIGSKDYRSISEGWAAVISSLKTFLEKGEPLSLGAWG